jgi:pimeloyl-ACP methyl ester carboxylesterase
MAQGRPVRDAGLMRSERRTYLMGHSMGSAGTFHLAVKYSGNWAATASIAPAAFRMDLQVLRQPFQAVASMKAVTDAR